ncbi:MAG: hypothetical protein IKA80_11035 [Spirochaetaceae bacterium]|nr:hypothetical protein [Spirochaetaceae bacterium]
MKRILAIVAASLLPFLVLAASYADNQYQKLAEAYAVRAEKAFEEGEYDLAVEYTAKAEENAELSRQYVEMMLLRADADTQIRVALNRLVWARSIKADENFPDLYQRSFELVQQAQAAFSGERYEEAKSLALQSMDALAGLQEMDEERKRLEDERKRLEEEALAAARAKEEADRKAGIPAGTYPEYYIIHDWYKTKDCFWNIAAKPFVYNDPFKWEVLYNANKGVLENSSNPDVIQPEIKIRIPSLAGEIREGTYDPNLEYEVFKLK